MFFKVEKELGSLQSKLSAYLNLYNFPQLTIVFLPNFTEVFSNLSNMSHLLRNINFVFLYLHLVFFTLNVIFNIVLIGILLCHQYIYN